MAMTTWSPFEELTRMRTQMDQLLGDLFAAGGDRQEQMPTFRLPIDVEETDKAYVIKAPVPGFKPEDVQVTLDGGVLSIRATHKEEREEKKEGRVLRREMSIGNMERHIALPADARSENIKATFENGVLRIEVPRAQRPAPQRIEVKASDQPQTDGHRTEQAKAEQKQAKGAA